ncbi:MAG: DNA repair protein, partial [Thermodesulfobacteriota bacterium]|nr:DNA repair protein [Thermodesulfobacteriota bacterium]
IYQLKTTLKEKFRQLHSPVQQFIAEHPIALQEGFPLSFQVKIVEEGFSATFFEYISQGVNGSFCGTEPGRQRLAEILDKTDFDSEESTISFLEETLANLLEDKRNGQGVPVAIDSQLKKNITEEELLNMLFSLSYLKPIYNLQWDDKGVELLSPGERGQLLLIFYLLIDRNSIPLIIDQPEENLDNQTVYKVLVPCIKEAKEKRQVILVTHNPNLAVVCDAEQIICVQMDKKYNNTVSYTTGAIENPAINRRIVEILEGTEPAFNVRKSKYQFAGKQE